MSVSGAKVEGGLSTEGDERLYAHDQQTSNVGHPHRILFLQCTNPGAYPPLIHAATLMGQRGWCPTFLSAPTRDRPLRMPPNSSVQEYATRLRPSHVMGKSEYAEYLAKAAGLALRLRPAAIYASDPLSAAPALLAARLAGALLVYHEHDTPEPGSLPHWLAIARRMVLKQAHLVVFPNAARAELAQEESGFPSERLQIVWNMPRLDELPQLTPHGDTPLTLYFHGGINPQVLPLAVIEAVRQFEGRVRVILVGEDTPGAMGYGNRLVEGGGHAGGTPLVSARGLLRRDELLPIAASAHVGLSFMPDPPANLNMRHMAGASNKAFDYLAAGLALLVSDLPDWRAAYVEPGYGLACRPGDAASVAAAIGHLLDNPGERRAMAMKGRRAIETEWNYDVAFEPVMAKLDLAIGRERGA